MSNAGSPLVVLLTPVSNETASMIDRLRSRIGNAKATLAQRGMRLAHFFLADGARELEIELPTLVRHPKSLGLATTLVEGYEAILRDLPEQPRYVVRCDADGEHDPAKIMDIVDAMDNTDAAGIALPVWYIVDGMPRPYMREVNALMGTFLDSLALAEEKHRAVVLDVYNNRFPMGFQAWRGTALAAIVQTLRTVLDGYRAAYSEPPSWGFDLLALLVGARLFPNKLDYVFGGWATPWKENRPESKIRAQRDRAERMIQIVQSMPR